MKNILTGILITAIAAFGLESTCLHANITLPSLFSDHMVLQQDSEVLIWGWGKPNETVTIKASWNEENEYTIKVNKYAKWKIPIQTPKAGGPYTMQINGYNEIQIQDILIGEVWMGSGQSNMEWHVSAQVENGEEEQEKANFNEIRFFTVPHSTSEYPQQKVPGEWVVCSPETMWNFSAVLYFFGKEIHQKLKVPVGLINSSWGGTPAEVWINKDVLKNDRIAYESALTLEPTPWGPKQPGLVYNTMINPLIPYKLKGVLWYQGESNRINYSEHARTLSTLIKSWRTAWNDDFPFYYVQIAPFAGYGEDNVTGAEIRDQHRKVLDMVDNTGMVVVSDIGNLDDIHPRNKMDVGKRLSFWALNKTYGFEDISFSGPLFKSYEWDGNNLVIHFNYAEGGLVSENDVIDQFEFLDQEGKWQPINGKISNSKMIIVDDRIYEASAIRFAFKNDSVPGIFNKAGLPTSSFKIKIKK